MTQTTAAEYQGNGLFSLSQSVKVFDVYIKSWKIFKDRYFLLTPLTLESQSIFYKVLEDDTSLYAP